ncbi:MAG: hypothetical protein RBT49_11385 [Bacteroidales bacterium]|jgi:hypothetical protein|nr:hypothetical protein [Bacteroidales bacterium]
MQETLVIRSFVILIDSIQNFQLILDPKQFQSSSTMSQTAPIIIPILVAAIAAIIALYQVKLNIILKARMSWIEKLRKEISDFISTATNLYFMIKSQKNEIETLEKHSDKKNNTTIGKFQKEILEYCIDLKKQGSNIKMFLITDDEHNKEIENQINLITDISEKSNVQDYDKLKEAIDTLVSSSMNVFNDEWEKANRLFNFKLSKFFSKKT